MTYSYGNGKGSPVWFKCPVARQEHNLRRRGDVTGQRDHTITLTGRTRPYKTARLGLRSTRTSREYKCSCGHTGWSNHIDLERMETKDA